MSDQNTLSKILKNIPKVYNKTLGTLGPSSRTGASSVVNIMDSASTQTDAFLDQIAQAKQETILGINPVSLSNLQFSGSYIDELASPGYLFTISSAIAATGNFIGFPKNLSKSFYMTIQNNSPTSVDVPVSMTYGNFNDYITGGYTPVSVTTDGTYLYITDSQENICIQMTMAGQFVSSFGAWNNFYNIISNGELVVSGDFFLFTPEFATSTGTNNLNNPSGVATNGNYLYTVDSANSRVIETFKGGAFGIYISEWGSLGSGTTNLNNPTGITTDGSYIYISDTGNNRVVKLPLPLYSITPATPLTAQWGSLGSGNTNLNTPLGLATDGTNLFIADSGNNRIVQIPNTLASGAYAEYWGSVGSGTTNLSNPNGVTLDSSYLYIADTGNKRVVKVALPLVSSPVAYTVAWSLPSTVAIPATPTTPAVPSVPTTAVDVFYYASYPYNSIPTPVIITCDSALGVIITDLVGNELSDVSFTISTPKQFTVPSGGSVTLQYTPDSVNPYTTPGTYDLINSSALPQLETNYSITDDIGADSQSFLFPNTTSCLDSIGVGFGIARLTVETDSVYKDKVKKLAFGNKITLPGITFQLGQSYGFKGDFNLKVYEGFTQTAVNTGFNSGDPRNTSQADLFNFLTTYVGGGGAIDVYLMNSNTLALTLQDSTAFIASLNPTTYPMNPYCIYATLTDKYAAPRGVFSGGKLYSYSPTGIGTFESLYTAENPTAIHNPDPDATNPPSTGYNLTATFGSAGTPPTYGGFLSTEQFASTQNLIRMAYLLSQTKAAGITAYIIQII